MKAVFKFVSDLEPPLDGLVLIRPSTDANGGAVLSCTVHGQFANVTGDVAKPLLSATEVPYPLVVRHYDEGRWVTRLKANQNYILPQAQILPGREILVVGKYSRRLDLNHIELNASLYGSNGELRRRALFGDGVQDVLATARGDVWVSYFDQGTVGDYGRLGWGRLSPEEWVDPVGYTGLVCFDQRGAKRFEFSPPPDFRIMTDCFALNVDGDDAWASYHPAFPVVKIRRDGSTLGWTAANNDVDAIAVHENQVLFVTSQANGDWRAVIGRFEAGQVVELGEVEIEAEDGNSLTSIRWIIGRGRCLDAFSERSWYRFDMASLG